MTSNGGLKNADVLIVAAEASSALYAQRLLELWKEQGQPIKAFGIGSQSMESLGFEIVGRSEQMAVVGLQEIIGQFPLIRRAFKELLRQADQRKPKLALLLDYPDFNLRLAKGLKKLGVPVVYYISPQLWAWRSSRVNLIRKIVDKMLVLFPFEVEFYDSHKVSVEFVGHPLLDEMKEDLMNPERRKELRQRYGILEDQLVLGLMPGSRHSELKYHLDTQLEVVQGLLKEFPKLKPVMLVAPTLSKEDVQRRLKDFSYSLAIVKAPPLQMLQISDVVLCASGTATLMTGLMAKPMVIMYRMNSMTAFWAKRLVRTTPFFGMVNLILGREVVPERFQEQASAEKLIEALRPLLSDQELRSKISNELLELRTKLGDKGATQRVARALVPYLQ